MLCLYKYGVFRACLTPKKEKNSVKMALLWCFGTVAEYIVVRKQKNEII